jgi:serine/threonine-protein kinase
MKLVLDRSRRPTPRTHGIDVPDAVEAVFARALSVDPRERPRDAGAFWKALEQAVGESEALASSPQASAFIPDLVPVSRRVRPVDPGEAAGPRFDFDDTGARGPALDLDLPADEPLQRRSFTPSGGSPAPAVEAIPQLDFGGPPSVPVATTPRTPVAQASPAPVVSSPPMALTPFAVSQRPVPPGASHRPISLAAEQAPPLPLPAPVAMPRLSVPSSPPTLARRLAPGIAMAAGSVVLTLLDHVYASFSGEVFSIGPLRTTWIAALLLVGGLGLVAVRLVALRHD